jgi:Flp pilus assembly protein TadG
MKARMFSRRRRDGAVTVEAALVLPICLIFLFGIFEYGRYVMFVQILTNAAREAARYAVTHVDPVVIGSTTYGDALSDVEAVLTRSLAGQQLKNQTVQIFCADSVGNNLGSWSTVQPGQHLCVRISGEYSVIMRTLLFMPSSMSVQVQAVVRSEAT